METQTLYINCPAFLKHFLPKSLPNCFFHWMYNLILSIFFWKLVQQSYELLHKIFKSNIFKNVLWMNTVYYQEEYNPLTACSCSLHRAGFSYLQARPPHAIEHCIWPGITWRRRSPTFVYFAVGRLDLPVTQWQHKIKLSNKNQFWKTNIKGKQKKTICKEIRLFILDVCICSISLIWERSSHELETFNNSCYLCSYYKQTHKNSKLKSDTVLFY